MSAKLPHSCRCGIRWGGLKTAHCTTCHTGLLSALRRLDHVGVRGHNVSDEVGHPLPCPVVLSPQLKVLDAVVGLVAIDVMNRFLGAKRAAQVLSHRETVAIGVPLGIRVDTVATNPYSRVAVRRKNRRHLSPRFCKRAPSAKAGRASGAVPTAGPSRPVTFRIAARLQRGATLSCAASGRTPTLPIRPGAVRGAAPFTLAFCSYPRTSRTTRGGAVLLPVVRRSIGGTACRALALAVGVTHSSKTTTFTVVSAFDKHRRNDACLDPTEAGLVLTDRTYECWGFPGREEENQA